MHIDVTRISQWEWLLAIIGAVFLVYRFVRLLFRPKAPPQELPRFNFKDYKRRQQQQDPDSTGAKID